MNRRKFLQFLGTTATAPAWPRVAAAEQGAVAVVGFLRVTSAADSAHLAAAFRQGLKESGFVDG
jgi:putative ABC transport system substrate-binding protein